MATIKTTDLLREIASAIRGDWSVDGRSTKIMLDKIAEFIDNGKLTLNEEEAQRFRLSHGLCTCGNGCWREYCDDCERW